MNHVRKTLFKAIPVGDRGQSSAEIKFYKNCSGEMKVGPLCLLTGLIHGKDNNSYIFMTGGSFTTWSQVPTKVRVLLSHRTWDIEALSYLMFTFQRHGSQVLEKDGLGF